jgi:cell division topological specificity factor
MRETIKKFFGTASRSKEEAKRRLKLLLIHDQLNLTHYQLEDMKRDIMDVVRQYLVINEDEADFRIDQVNEHIALVSSLPVAKIRLRGEQGS